MNRKQKVAIVVCLMLVAGLGLAACGGDGEPPGVPGTYSMDRKATISALRAFADAEGDSPLADIRRSEATLVEQGEIEGEFRLSPDGTFSLRARRGNKSADQRGTWSLHGDQLSLEVKHPPGADSLHAKYHAGAVEVLDGKAGRVLGVFRRK